MSKLKQILDKYNIKPIKYSRKGKVIIVDTLDNKYVIKENTNNHDIYTYLLSRSFDYFPKVISDINEEYEITLYEEELFYPEEQKLNDMIELLSLLHSKTSYYKNIDNDEYKKIYEDLVNNIEYLISYYNDVITIIESKVYYSPSEYLLARNITKIFYRIEELKKDLNTWFNLIKDKTKARYVVLHNNLDLTHFIKNNDAFLLNWDKSKIDMPIFDLYKVLIKNPEYSFNEVLKKYEEKYPLLHEEKVLLIILLKMPGFSTLTNNEFLNTSNIRKIINNIDITENIKLPNESKY